MPRTPPSPDDDPLADFELPPELMSHTLEHAISDDAGVSHELGHAVAARVERALKHSRVEYGFPGVLTVHLDSGAIAFCGGPGIGWMVDLVRTPGGATTTVELDVADDESDAEVIADALVKVLRRA